MRSVLQHLTGKIAEFERQRLFDYLRDESVDPRSKLAFAPYAAHFVFSFADLCSLLLREEPTTDRLQEVINRHTREDDYHWRWFLTDLETLGYNPRVPLTTALGSIWGDATRRTRLLSYRMCSMGVDADPVQRLVLIFCVEGAFKPTIAHIGLVARQFKAATGKELNYLGNEHSDTEESHTIESPEVRAMIEDIVLDEARARELRAMVDRLFAQFFAFSDELLDLAKAPGLLNAS